MKAINDRIAVLKAGIVYTFQIETAYWANNWGNAVSTFMYVSMQLLFLEVIFNNVDLVAGYRRDEMLLFFVISQMWFYSLYAIFFRNIKRLIEMVNTGELDLVLTKPIPTLFYITLARVNLYSTFRDGIIPMIIIILPINFSNLTITPINLFTGILIFVLGCISSYCINVIASLPAFWIAESSSILDVSISLEDSAGHLFPFEGWSNIFKIIFTTIFPAAISSALSTSVILGKTNGLLMLILAAVVTAIFILLKNKLWHIALKNYTSASS